MFNHRWYLLVSLIGLVALLLATPAMASGPGSKPARQQISRMPAPPKTATYVPGRALVQFRPGVTMAGMRGAAASADAVVQREIKGNGAADGGRLLVVRSTTATTRQLVNELSEDPRVELAEPDYILRVDATPNDPRFDELWGMQQVSAPGAWSISTGSTNVVIADIDTGVDYSHADLAANMWQNSAETPGNSIDDDGNGWVDDVYGIDPANGDGDPMDDHGHGTHTSGTVAAVGDNSVGVTGVAWQAKIMALKFLDADGSGATSDAITCINYAIAQDEAGVNVAAINASWGGGAYSESLRTAINAAGARGIVFVASAGNGGEDGIGDDNDVSPSYPGSYDCANIIAVAATDRHDELADFSNYGATSVDIAAPGVGILSTADSGYASWNGTSMAAPHVTGAIALCAAEFPAETITQRIARVLGNADAVTGLSGKTSSGGRLNVQTTLGGPAPSDDDIPGIPLGVSPVAGTLTQSSDMNDVYRVYLEAGKTITARVSGNAGTNVDLFLFSPGTANVSSHGVAVAQAVGVSYPDSFDYTVPTTGTYYLDAYAAGGSGAYQLTVASDDEIPGVPIMSSPITGTLSSTTDADDVFAVHLDHGDVLQASVSGPLGSDYRLFLYAPGADSVWTDTPVGGVTGGVYPRAFQYSAWRSGTYYLDAYAYSGTGAYTITYAVTAATADDDIPGVQLTPSPVGGDLVIAGDCDVFSFHATAGQSIQMNLTGAAGTDFDLHLYGPGTPTVVGTGAVAWSIATSYPENITYTAATTGVHYILVYAYDGAGTYQLTHNVDFVAPVTAVIGADSAWHRTPVTLAFSATDTGSGVAYTEYDIDGGGYVRGNGVTISANGSHTVAFRSVDNQGNIEAAQTTVANVDAGKPATFALANVRVRRGKKAAMRYRANDMTPQASFQIKVYKGRKLVKVLKPGVKATNTAQKHTWTCRLARGKYTWKVYATDLAGNRQGKIGYRTLTVK